MSNELVTLPGPVWGNGAAAPLVSCGVYNASANVKASDGNIVALQTDILGYLKVNLAAGSITVTTGNSGTVTDRSGTVTTGGTNQQIMGANANRKYLLIENPPLAAETLFINLSGAASTSDGKSIQLAPGGSFEMTIGTYISTEAINVTAATMGHVFIAKEG